VLRVACMFLLSVLQEPSAGEGGGGVGWALCILSGLSVYLLSVHFCHNIKQAV